MSSKGSQKVVLFGNILASPQRRAGRWYLVKIARDGLFESIFVVYIYLGIPR